MVLLFSERPLEGFHIVVDAGNGAGGFFSVGFIHTLISNKFLYFLRYEDITMGNFLKTFLNMKFRGIQS